MFDGPNLLRDGAMETVSGGTRAPSTPGSLRGKSLLLRGLNPLLSVISTPLAALGLAAEAVGTARAAIGRIPEDAWTAIEYPQAVWDDQLVPAREGLVQGQRMLTGC